MEQDELQNWLKNSELCKNVLVKWNWTQLAPGFLSGKGYLHPATSITLSHLKVVGGLGLHKQELLNYARPTYVSSIDVTP